ncbi:MAG: hypothetical protein QME51_09880 [Planctomycetota bacterium]|nr:hypothetical protein [Planctomycetota bacterium]
MTIFRAKYKPFRCSICLRQCGGRDYKPMKIITNNGIPICENCINEAKRRKWIICYDPPCKGIGINPGDDMSPGQENAYRIYEDNRVDINGME